MFNLIHEEIKPLAMRTKCIQECSISDFLRPASERFSEIQYPRSAPQDLSTVTPMQHSLFLSSFGSYFSALLDCLLYVLLFVSQSACLKSDVRKQTGVSLQLTRDESAQSIQILLFVAWWRSTQLHTFEASQGAQFPKWKGEKAPERWTMNIVLISPSLGETWTVADDSRKYAYVITSLTHTTVASRQLTEGWQSYGRMIEANFDLHWRPLAPLTVCLFVRTKVLSEKLDYSYQ